MMARDWTDNFDASIVIRFRLEMATRALAALLGDFKRSDVEWIKRLILPNKQRPCRVSQRDKNKAVTLVTA